MVAGALAERAGVAWPWSARRRRSDKRRIDIAQSNGGLLSLYFQRRRAMSNHQLEGLGLVPSTLSLTDDYMPAEAAAETKVDDRDIVWSISQLETKFYLGNTLLRNGDANGMAHSLEIRVPLLDQRLLDLALALPGPVRMPSGSAANISCGWLFPSCCDRRSRHNRSAVLNCPCARWMLGPLRELCMSGLAAAKATNMLHHHRIDAIWHSYEQKPDSPMWSRAFALCVSGLYLPTIAH